MARTREFTREALEEMGVPFGWDATPGKEAEILDRIDLDTGRWTSYHDVIFIAPDDGKTYRSGYQEGLTEYQDDTDTWYDEDTVTATEVEPYEVTVTKWRDVA